MQKGKQKEYNSQKTTSAVTFINTLQELFSQAADYHQNGDLPGAAELYQRIHELDNENIEALYNLGVVKHAMGQSSTAAQIYQRVLDKDADFLPAHFSLGNVMRDLERTREAEEAYYRALALEPDNIAVLINLANLFYSDNRFEEAVSCYSRILELDQSNSQAHYNLGLIHHCSGSLEEAAKSYELAAKCNPFDGDAWYNLGIVLTKMGRHEEAAAAYKAAIDINPHDADAHYNLGNVLQEVYQLSEAVDCYRRTLELEPSYAKAAASLGAVHHILGERETALSYYRQAIHWGLDTPGNRHMIHALAGEQTDHPPMEYILDVFDNTAGRFDTYLQEKLGYSVPAKLKLLLDSISNDTVQFNNVLDLGCGTGLSGAPFREIAARLVGVDVSSGMLKVAAEKEIYDHLQQEDIIEYLKQAKDSFDLIVCSDVFIYLGNLQSFFDLIGRCAAPGALLLCSTENCGCQGVSLQPSGRYAHDYSYIKTLAQDHGFKVLQRQAADIRRERSEWIKGELLLLQRQII